MSVGTAHFRRNILALFSLQAVTFVLPLIVTPYLVRAIGAEGFGRIAFAMAIVSYLVVLTDYGFNLSATRQVALLCASPTQLSRLVSTVLFLKGLLLLGCSICLFCVVLIIPTLKENWKILLVAWLSVLGHVIFPIWLIQGLERVELITRSTIAAQVIGMVGIFIFVEGPSDLLIATGLQAMTPLLAGFLSWYGLRTTTRISFVWPDALMIRESLVDGWHIFISTVAISFYTATNILVLGLLTNATVVGHFAAADRLIKAALGLINPVSQVFYPHISKLSAQDKSTALIFVKKLLRWQSIGALILSIIIFVSSEFFVDILFGPQFEQSKILLKIMAPLPFLVGISNVLGVQTMLNFDMKRHFSAILIASGVINLILLMLLIPISEAKGASLSVLITELVVTLTMAIILARQGYLQSLLRWN